MNIEIKNCNNVDLANIVLSTKKLNIKYAPNGTGKSTIANAILYSSDGNQDKINVLMPFKLRSNNQENKRPEVNGASDLKNILCFNEAYVSQFVFKQDELLSDSFDIFIKTDAYKQKEQEIEDLMRDIKELFSQNTELEKLIDTLNEMGNAFKKTTTGKISKSSTGMKALIGGNKIQHVPAGLEAYTPFIQSEQSVNWIDWQTKGNVFTELSENCPFCTSQATDKKEQIKKVALEYDKNTIRNLIAIIEVIEKLGDFFSPEAKEKLRIITTLKEGLENEHEAFLVTVKTQIDNFIEKLVKLKTLSSFQFKDGEKVAEKLPLYKLDLKYFSELSSTKMLEAITPINNSIDTVAAKASTLQGKINQQRIEIRRTVERHQNDINNFLTYAGYRYKVEIVGEGQQSQLKLRHVDHEGHLSGGSQHLSFGEKNAFAIVLFMYECLAKKPDLIILDDPISSFDKNKKYAILDMLFRRETDYCLKNKTVLMLTHDVEPIIDMVKTLSEKFSNQTSASFLKLKDGTIRECSITKINIQTFSQICTNAINSGKDDIIKLIYMRRNLEINDDKGDAYQVLSNVFHKRERATDHREPSGSDGSYPEMELSKFKTGCSAISAALNGFSYPDIVCRLNDVSVLRSLYSASTNGYERLQIFRLLELNIENTVIKKFINETYHIENELICQLDPTEFDTIPEYVISECDSILKEA